MVPLVQLMETREPQLPEKSCIRTPAVARFAPKLEMVIASILEIGSNLYHTSSSVSAVAQPTGVELLVRAPKRSPSACVPGTRVIAPAQSSFDVTQTFKSKFER